MNTAMLPRDITIQLTATDHRNMDLISDMVERSAKKNPSKKGYVCPGEEWIAQRLGRCRQAISESVQKLHKLGILKVINRRKIKGHFQTNLYKLGYWLLRAAGNLKSLISNVSLPCRLQATHSIETNNNSKTATAKKEVMINKKVKKETIVDYDAIRIRREAEYPENPN